MLIKKTLLHLINVKSLSLTLKSVLKLDKQNLKPHPYPTTVFQTLKPHQ